MPISSPSIWGMLADWANNDFWPIINAGPPTSGGSGTGNGLTGKGSFCIDITNGNLYVNVNTKASPTWVSIGGALTGAILSSSSILSNGTAGVGYGTGAGGTVTQATSKSTGVTLNKTTGQITMNGAALAGQTTVGFTVTNSTVAATDVIIVNIKSGATVDEYRIQVDAIAAGSFRISLRNETAGSLSEAVVLQFAVIKGVNA